MKGRGGRILCCLALCLFTANTAASDSSCERATVVFPNRNIRLDVNPTPTTVHFNISSDCFDRVTIKNGQGQKCNIRSPAPTDRDCPCHGTGAGFWCSTSGNFSRRSLQTWTVEVAKGVQKTPETAVTFNVTYPTILENFTVIHYGNKSPITVLKGNCMFRCDWKAGNLKQSVELRGPRNNTLITWTRRDFDQTSFPLSCADSGEYRCQVKGTHEFKSLTVLVKCPLVFKRQSPSIPEQAVEAGSDASFSFQVTSYSATLQTCQLTKPDRTSVDCNSTTSAVNVLGSPPHLDVTLTLKRVTEKDGGNWKLAASNPYVPIATAEKRFRLSVTQPTTSSSEKADMMTSPTSSLSTSRQSSSTLDSQRQDNQTDMSVTTKVAIAVGIVAVVVIAAIVVGVYVWRRRRNSQRGVERGSNERKHLQLPTDGERMYVNDIYGDSDCAREIINDMYETSGGPTAPNIVSDTLYEVVPDDAGNKGLEAGDNTYVAQEEIRRNKQKKKGTDNKVPAEDNMYVAQEEIQRNKARNKGKAKKESSDADEGNMYVAQEEIQRNKARNKAGKAKKESSDHEAGDTSEAMYVDQDQIRRNKALNKQRTNN